MSAEKITHHSYCWKTCSKWFQKQRLCLQLLKGFCDRTSRKCPSKFVLLSNWKNFYSFVQYSFKCRWSSSQRKIKDKFNFPSKIKTTRKKWESWLSSTVILLWKKPLALKQVLIPSQALVVVFWVSRSFFLVVFCLFVLSCIVLNLTTNERRTNPIVEQKWIPFFNSHQHEGL